MQARIKFFLFTFIFVFASCKREEPTTWDVDVLAPIAHGHLTLDDIVPDSLLEYDETGLWHLVLNENITDFNLDSLVEIPDTVIRKSFSIPLIGGPWSLPPGQQLISESDDNKLSVNDVELKEVITKSGMLQYSVKSYTNAYLHCVYNLPGVTYNGQPTVIETETQPGSQFVPNEQAGSIDLSGYHIDLTGESGFESNKIFSQLTVSVSENSPGNAMVFGQDSVAIELHFVNPKVEYARGYFGQHNYVLDETVDFAGDVNLPTGAFNLETVSLNFKVENNVGVDAQIDFDALHSINGASDVVLANADIYQVMNISRAEDLNGIITPDVEEVSLNNDNSNVDVFIENLPTQLRIEGNVVVNPLGDISAGNDFIYTANALNTFISLDIPLCVGMQGLTLTDTLDISSETNFSGSGTMFMDFTNAFPFSASVSLVLIDENDEVVTAFLSGQQMDAATLMDAESTIPASSTWSIFLTQEEINLINSSHRLFISTTFNTPSLNETVKLYKDYFIDFRLRVDANMEVSAE